MDQVSRSLFSRRKIFARHQLCMKWIMHISCRFLFLAWGGGPIELPITSVDFPNLMECYTCGFMIRIDSMISAQILDDMEDPRSKMNMAWLRVFNLQEMQGEGTSFVEIDPPPVYRNLPRPHLIVFRSTARSITPVLVEATFRETVLLGSMLLWSESGSFQVETLFNLALPGHDCRGMSDCYAIVRGWNLLVSHDVVLFSGDFIRISEWPNTPDSLADDSTCLDSLATTLSEPDMADSWSSTPSTQERAEIASDRALSNDGDNTATPLWDLHVGATETPEPAQDDTLSLFQPILQQRDTSLGSPVMTRPPEDMQGEVQQAWLWGRSVELTRRSTKIWGFDTLRQRLWPIKRPEGFGPMSY